MATLLTKTLKDQYAALQEERERSWSAAQLESNARQRSQLVERFDAAAVAQRGDVLPPMSFAEVGGATLSLDALTAEGSALFIFFRFAGCPACNIALPYYADTLYPALAEHGIKLDASKNSGL